MIIIDVSGPTKDVAKATSQIITLMQTAGKIVKTFDASIAEPPEPDVLRGHCDVCVIKRPEAT